LGLRAIVGRAGLDRDPANIYNRLVRQEATGANEND
jgi:hypothetical protein